MTVSLKGEFRSMWCSRPTCLIMNTGKAQLNMGNSLRGLVWPLLKKRRTIDRIYWLADQLDSILCAVLRQATTHQWPCRLF